MKKIGLKINTRIIDYWNLKKEILLFDQLQFDLGNFHPEFKMWENFLLLKNKTQLLEELYQMKADVGYLIDQKELTSFNLQDTRLRLEEIITEEQKEYLSTISLGDYFYEGGFRRRTDDFTKLMHLFEEYKMPMNWYEFNPHSVSDFNQMYRIDEPGLNQNFLLNQYFQEVQNIINEDSNHIPLTDTPVFFQMKNEFSDQRNKTEITSIIFKQFPFPDSSIPLEDIIDFKRDKDTQIRLMRLRNWMNEISYSRLNMKEIEERLEYYIKEYERHLELLTKKRTTANFSILFKAPLEFIEAAASFKFSKVSELLFKFRYNLIDHEINKAKSPGREVAYIVESKKKFGT